MQVPLVAIYSMPTAASSSPSYALCAGVSQTLVQQILAKVTPHLPVTAPAVKPAAAMQAALVNLNLAAAKLLARFLPAGHAEQESEEERGWRQRLLEYYIGVMESGQVLPSQ